MHHETVRRCIDGADRTDLQFFNKNMQSASSWGGVGGLCAKRCPGDRPDPLVPLPPLEDHGDSYSDDSESSAEEEEVGE